MDVGLDAAVMEAVVVISVVDTVVELDVRDVEVLVAVVEELVAVVVGLGGASGSPSRVILKV